MTTYLRVVKNYSDPDWTQEQLAHWNPLGQFVCTSDPKTLEQIVVEIDRYNFVEAFFSGWIVQDPVSVKAVLDDMTAHGFVHQVGA